MNQVATLPKAIQAVKHSELNAVTTHGATRRNALLSALLREAAEQGLDQAALAAKLGAQETYLRQLHDGTRLTEHIGRDFAAACARFLGVPTALVLLMAGRIQLADFVHPHRGDGDIKRALRALARDEYFGPWVPPELTACPESVKRLVVFLFEAATQTDHTGYHAMPEQLHRLMLAGLQLEDHDSPVPRSCAG